MRLLLFDIDGTLVQAKGAGRAALARALEQLFGTAGPIDTYDLGGKTDPRIVTDLLLAAGFPLADVQARLSSVYEVMTEHGRTVFHQYGLAPCPGVPALLAALDNCPDILLGLVTGNIEATAPLKLAAAGLDPTRFRVGAYGSDHEDRDHLPALAMQRAARLTGRPFTGRNTVVIGDTPADIQCARASEAIAIAVATGRHTAAQLAPFNPDFLFDDLSNTAAVLKALCNE